MNKTIEILNERIERKGLHEREWPDYEKMGAVLYPDDLFDGDAMSHQVYRDAVAYEVIDSPVHYERERVECIEWLLCLDPKCVVTIKTLQKIYDERYENVYLVYKKMGYTMPMLIESVPLKYALNRCSAKVASITVIQPSALNTLSRIDYNLKFAFKAAPDGVFIYYVDDEVDMIIDGKPRNSIESIRFEVSSDGNVLLTDEDDEYGHCDLSFSFKII